MYHRYFSISFTIYKSIINHKLKRIALRIMKSQVTDDLEIKQKQNFQFRVMIYPLLWKVLAYNS